MTKRVAIYARVSTNDQSCRDSWWNCERSQRTTTEIVQKYVDTGVSGAKTSRPQLNAMR